MKTSTLQELEASETHHHEDPITGEPGSHPLGAGVGAASGAVTGAVVGAIGGPAGAALGAIVGGVAGGLMGKEVADSLDPLDGARAVAPPAWEAYWRDAYLSEPYYDPDYSYEEYLPAYRLGYETHVWQRGTLFEDVESSLKNRWNETRAHSRLPWAIAREAIRASWVVLDDKGEALFSQS
ncbi:MAG TPA: hypothetical protein VK956_19245 [Verrucomicrobium sp.]|nr:hypothetical protein [Verrucomicrobium sp.]